MRSLGVMFVFLFLFLLGVPAPIVAQKPQPPPSGVVYSFIEDQTSGVLTINGTNLVLTGVDPVVTLEMTVLAVVTATPSRIDVQLPAVTTPGTYFLIVRRGTKETDVAYFAVAIGENGPQGEQGDAGATGPAGAAGPAGAPGAAGAQGPQGLMGPPGPNGANGTTGVSGWQRVSVDWPMPAIGSTVGAFAECPAGKKALGGGWFGPSSDQVSFARQEPADNAYTVIVRNVSTPLPNYIRVTVICATVP